MIVFLNKVYRWFETLATTTTTLLLLVRTVPWYVRYRTAVSYRKKRNGCVVRGDVWCDVVEAVRQYMFGYVPASDTVYLWL
jgi:hypothetical protein